MAARGSKAPFLGTGWAFPPRFGSEGAAVMVSGAADVEESLRILIATRLGERIMLPTYGTPLETFNNMTVTAVNNIKSQIRASILRHEPRVNVEKIEVRTPEGGREGELLIEVEYEIPATNSRANMVFPFYFSEGNLVRLSPGPPPDAGAA